MQPTTIGWVAAAAFLVGAIVRLLKSDSLNIVLANFGRPPIPKEWLPFIALALGAASSVLDMKMQGTSWPEAVTKGLIAALTAIAGHETGIESLRGGKELGADDPPVGPPKSGAYRANAKAADPAKPRGSSSQRAMLGVRFAPAALILMLALLPGCAWFKKHEALFPTPADIECVATDVDNGVTDPAKVVADCPHLAVLAIEDVVALIEGNVGAKRIRMSKGAPQ